MNALCIAHITAIGHPTASATIDTTYYYYYYDYFCYLLLLLYYYPDLPRYAVTPLLATPLCFCATFFLCPMLASWHETNQFEKPSAHAMIVLSRLMNGWALAVLSL